MRCARRPRSYVSDDVEEAELVQAERDIHGDQDPERDVRGAPLGIERDPDHAHRGEEVLDEQERLRATLQEGMHEGVELLGAMLEVTQGREGVDHVEHQDRNARERDLSVERTNERAAERLHARTSSKRGAALESGGS